MYERCTKKLKPCNQKYVSESNLEDQLRQIICDCGLSQGWESYFEKWIVEAEEKDKITAELESQKLDSEIQETEIKLNRLLDRYLDQVIEPEVYKQKKNELFEEKLRLTQKKSQIENDDKSWIKPMKEFVNCALRG